MNRPQHADPASLEAMVRNQAEVAPDFNLETSEAVGAWIIVENVLKETGTIVTSKPIRTGGNLVHLVGPSFKPDADIQPGDSIVFGGGGVALECKGLNGGALVGVRADQLIAIDRSWRKPPKREKARHGALWFFRAILGLDPKPDEPKPDEPKPSANGAPA